MVKVNRSGSHKTGSDKTPPDEKQETQASSQPASSSIDQKKSKQGAKARRPAIGGTAVQGAKSTVPKELSTATPANQQAEYYNRDMRRRMQHMGTGPYSERPSINPRERKKKRLERLKERQERIKHTVDAKGPSRDIKLGRRNAYFLIAIVVALVLLIAVFVILRRPF
jgi:hypothetical protein